jgi:hypothetical protein
MMEMNEEARTGIKSPTFLDDYYYRIHVSPLTVPLGAILSPIYEEFIVWNAWFASKTCSSIVEDNPTEYTLTGLTSPFTLKALYYITYGLNVTEEGSSEFTASITFDFTAEAPVVFISGTRIYAFRWEPLLPMKEKLSWLTQVIKGKSGKEQRIALRRTPRQGFALDVYFNNEQDQTEFETSLFSWQKRTWGVPVWAERVEHTATITAGDTIINVDTTNADFRDESLAIVYQSKDNYEVVKVDTKTGSVLNLEVEMQNSFTGSKLIMPVREANMIRKVDNKAAPDGYSKATCEFLVTANELLTGFTASDTYLGLTVLTDPTYVHGAQSYESDGDIVISDSGVGAFDVFSDSEFNIISQDHLFKNWTKAECWSFRLFLHHLYGRQVPIWIPTFKNDLQQTQTIGAADVNFRVSNVGLTDNMGSNDLRKHAAFMFPNGTNIYREITGYSESGDEEVLSIGSSLGVEVQVGDCEICWLDKYRLASDEVEINWNEPFRNVSGMRFVRVEE